jgi:protein-S-isoprenylcysteine O-methyltransferase Ste14
MRFLCHTPVRTFIIYPVLVIVWELISNRGSFDIKPMFLVYRRVIRDEEKLATRLGKPYIEYMSKSATLDLKNKAGDKNVTRNRGSGRLVERARI